MTWIARITDMIKAVINVGGSLLILPTPSNLQTNTHVHNHPKQQGKFWTKFSPEGEK
jgi:hypothetical protein